ncbi:MAG: DUF1376 domain-containing protein [Chitinophagaceae bacterium]|nr:DUF1376 domain-containing protein [Chitinophagaceae bacterium]
MNTSPENFMPLWIADYLADTMHLTARQHGAYLLLLMYSWKQDRPLPKADAALRAIARVSEDEWQQDKDTILAFFCEGQDGLRQKRLEEERAEATERFNSLKARSALGVAARQAKAASAPVVLPEVIPKVTLEADTTHNSHISKDIKDMSGSAAPDGYPAAFESFWKAYPRTQNMSKTAAFKAWQRVKSHLPDLPSLLASVAKYRAFLDRETQKQGGRVYPAKHAQGWLGERRWEGFMADEKPNAAATEHSPDWADSVPEWQAFKASLAPAQWAIWFATTRPNGSVSTLVVPSSFAAQEIEKRFGQQLVQHFGNSFELKVKP